MPAAKKKTTKKKITKKKLASSKDLNQLAEKLIGQLLDYLEVKAKIEVSDDEGLIRVQLEADDPGMLIGYHGETLSALQLLLSLMVYRQKGEWTRILVNVGDYREKRQESLEKMALSAAQRVRFSGETQAMPPMPSMERRIIHLALSNEVEVTTESEGEGNYRRVIVKPKSKSG